MDNQRRPDGHGYIAWQSSTEGQVRWEIVLSALWCLAILHSPDGQELRIDVRHIAAMRPAHSVKQHLAHGTNTLVYVTTNTFGVIETKEQVQDAIHHCVDGETGEAPE